MVMEVTDSLVIELVPNFLIVDVVGGEDVAVDDSVEEVSGIVVTDDHHRRDRFVAESNRSGRSVSCLHQQNQCQNLTEVTTLPDEYPEAHSAINDLRLEYVVATEGIVRSQSSESINKKMKTGFIEVAANKIQVLNSVNSKLPFLVTTTDDAKDSLKEEIRLRH